MVLLKNLMATTSDGPSQLFVGSLPVTLLQPNKNGPEYMSTVADVALKIVERRLDSGEKEYCVEISRPDDFEFLYAEGITRTKYQTLAKKWNLNVDFDDFPARIIRLLRERVGAAAPVQLTCTLSQDLSICTFEMVHIIDMYTVRMPIELRAVRDKDLLCHIINNIRSLQKQVSKLKAEKKQVENERDELKCMVDDLKEFRLKADQRLSELEQRAKDAEKRAADETLRREEFEQDLQLERDERDSALSTIENLKDELSEAEKKAHELEEELDQCEEECEELEGKLRDSELTCSRLRGDKEKLVIALDKAKKDLSKANHVISKYLKDELRSPSERSLDERKDEMAADLKIKESLIDEMTASIADYKKKVDDLTKENRELRDTLQVMEAEHARNTRVIEMYRNQHRVGTAFPAGASPPMFPGLGTTALLAGRTSPLLGCMPATPSNFRNVLGRTLHWRACEEAKAEKLYERGRGLRDEEREQRDEQDQSNTALLTPSMRTTPPALKGRLTNSDGRENLPLPTLGNGPTVVPPK